jgi:hypothetical protein
MSAISANFHTGPLGCTGKWYISVWINLSGLADIFSAYLGYYGGENNCNIAS